MTVTTVNRLNYGVMENALAKIMADKLKNSNVISNTKTNFKLKKAQ